MKVAVWSFWIFARLLKQITTLFHLTKQVGSHEMLWTIQSLYCEENVFSESHCVLEKELYYLCVSFFNTEAHDFMEEETTWQDCTVQSSPQNSKLVNLV